MRTQFFLGIADICPLKEGFTAYLNLGGGGKKHYGVVIHYPVVFLVPLGPLGKVLSGTKIASQNRSDHGGRKRARNHSAAEIAGFFASPAAKKSLAASDFWGWRQNCRKIAATTAASRRSRAISLPQRPWDTKVRSHLKMKPSNLA